MLFAQATCCLLMLSLCGIAAADGVSISIVNPGFAAVNAVDFQFGGPRQSGQLIPEGSYLAGFGHKLPLCDVSNGSVIAGAAASLEGWSIAGSGGVIHSGSNFPMKAPNGSAGFLLVSGDQSATIFQSLKGTRLKPHTRYCLSVQVFDRDSRPATQQDVIAFPKRVAIQLLAGETVLASGSGPSANGSGETWTLTYDSPTSGLPTSDITIAITASGFDSSGYANAQVVVDDVTLTASPITKTLGPGDARKLAFFETNIRPVLEQHCLKCHNDSTRKGGLALDQRDGWLVGGESGPAIIEGSPENSLLLSALRHESFEMPPKGRLPDEVIEKFATWIAEGALDPRTAEMVASRANEEWEAIYRDRLKWWSLQPITRPRVPSVHNQQWPRGEIDQFILHSLEAKQLNPATSADRRTLARRLSFAITGLPPQVNDVARFVHSKSPDACEHYVDKLLASPHFGERWARHWMDVMHYADTHGYEWDIPAKEVWRYRDYLIRAFNADVPFDQLLLEHVAGDLLDRPRIGPDAINESIIGAAALRLGERRHGDNGEAIAGGVTEEAVDNIIDTLSKGFLGTTVGCAQCHNHKLDAISQHDYFALAGSLMSSRWLVRSIDAEDPNLAAIEQLRRMKHNLRQEVARQWLAAVDALPARLMKTTATKVAAETPFPETPVALWGRLRSVPEDSAVAGKWSELAKQWQVLHDERIRANAGLQLIADFRGEQLPTGWHLEGLGMQSGLVRGGELVVASEGNAAIQHVLPAGRWSHVWSQRLGGAVRGPMMDNWECPSVQIGCSGGSAAAYGLIVDHALFPEALRMTYLKQGSFGWLAQPTKVGSHRVYFELSTKAYNNNFPPRVDLSPGGENDLRSWCGITRVYAVIAPQDELRRFESLFHADAPTSAKDAADQIAAWLRRIIQNWQQGELNDEEVATINGLLAAGWLPNNTTQSPQLKRLVDEYRVIADSLQTDRVVGSIADLQEGRNERLRVRGSYTDFAEEVQRGNLRFFGSELATDATGSGRLEVARNWASPQNPLTSRVFVNRVWSYLFGEGLVRTPDDFGHLGATPSHPELLDWLASQFVEEGWSTKQLVRRIVLSSTWQQSGEINQACLTADPDNTLWHHMPPRRLDAESIRDSLLAASGRLDATMYGQPIEPYRSAEDKDKRLYRGPLDGDGRRSVYLRMTLMEPPRFLALFNQPIPKQTIGHRDVTNVPDQALALLNDPLVIAMARHWSEQVVKDPTVSIDERLQAMFAKAMGRPAANQEASQLAEFVSQSAHLHKVAAADVLRSVDVWQDVAHTLFNAKEFIYVP